MFVSPRFRDIFSSGTVKTRRDDDSTLADRTSRTALGAAQPATDADAIWRDITAAHRRAARAFTPEFNRASEMVQDER